MDRIANLVTRNPSWRLLGKDRLYKMLKGLDKTVTLKQVTEYLDDKPLQQVFRKLVKPVPFKITAVPRSFQIDLIHLPKYGKQNGGMTRFLLIVDVMSRHAWAWVCKSGKMEEIMKHYKAFIRNVGHVNSMTGDAFFSSKEFLQYNAEKGISTYTDVAKDDHLAHGDKLGVVDRLTRTLKSLIRRKMVLDDDVKWSTWLQDILDLYNSSPHRSLHGGTPDAWWGDQASQEVQHSMDSVHNAEQYKQLKVQVGDVVRIHKGKATFGKEDITFSKELYAVVGKSGYKFNVVDEHGKPYKRALKAHELLKVSGKESERLKAIAVAAAEKTAYVNRQLQKEGLPEASVEAETVDSAGNRKTIGELLKVDQLAVLDVEGAQDDYYVLLVKKGRKIGYVYVGKVTKATRTNVFMHLFKGTSGDTNISQKRLKLSDKSYSIDAKADADALLYHGEPPRIRSDGTTSIPAKVINTVKREYVFS